MERPTTEHEVGGAVTQSAESTRVTPWRAPKLTIMPLAEATRGGGSIGSDGGGGHTAS